MSVEVRLPATLEDVAEALRERGGQPDVTSGTLWNFLSGKKKIVSQDEPLDEEACSLLEERYGVVFVEARQEPAAVQAAPAESLAPPVGDVSTIDGGPVPLGPDLAGRTLAILEEILSLENSCKRLDVFRTQLAEHEEAAKRKAQEESLIISSKHQAECSRIGRLRNEAIGDAETEALKKRSEAERRAKRADKEGAAALRTITMAISEACATANLPEPVRNAISLPTPDLPEGKYLILQAQDLIKEQVGLCTDLNEIVKRNPKPPWYQIGARIAYAKQRRGAAQSIQRMVLAKHQVLIIRKARREAILDIARQSSESLLDGQTLRAEAVYRASIEAISLEKERLLADVGRSLESTQTRVYARGSHRVEKRSARLQSVAWLLRQQAAELTAETAAAQWDDASWQSWESSRVACQDLWLGNWLVDTPRFSYWHPSEPPFALPAFVPFYSDRHLFVHPGSHFETADRMATNAVLRFLATHRPGGCHATFIDPFGLSDTVIRLAFRSKSSHGLDLFRLLKTQEEIERELTWIVDSISAVAGMLTGNRAETVVEFNSRGPMVLPYRLLVAFGFPRGFNDVALARLNDIMLTGPPCGVQVLLVRGDGSAEPSDLPAGAFTRHCRVIQGKGSTLRFEEGPLSRCFLQPGSLPPTERQHQIIDGIAAAVQKT